MAFPLPCRVRQKPRYLMHTKSFDAGLPALREGLALPVFLAVIVVLAVPAVVAVFVPVPVPARVRVLVEVVVLGLRVIAVVAE